MSGVRLTPGLDAFLADLAGSEETAAALGNIAEGLRTRVRAADRFSVFAASGIGPQGAYGQVIMRGPGAVVEEFGSRSRPAAAPLRSALRGGR